MASGRGSEGGGDPRTPMAWQHRDLNYHQSGYQDRYGPGAEGPGRGGPPSSSDRLSHRTDRSWQQQQQQQQAAAYSSTPQQSYPPRDYPTGRAADYPPSHSAREYSHYSQRDQYPPQHSRDMSPSDHPQPSSSHHFSSHHPPGPSSRRQDESRHSATATSTISSSSSSGGEDSEEQAPNPQMMPPMGPGHPAFGGGYNNAGYYPGYAPSQAGYAPSVAPNGGAYHGGTIKSARSVPALLAATYDGEPCPVHHHGGGGGGMPPMSLPPVPMPMMHPGYATMGHPRRAASIYDMRVMSPAPPPMAIYGTLPHPSMPPPPSDARSMVGGSHMGGPMGIPPQLLPPMARPRPVVIGEGGGAPEALPVRGGLDKGATLPKALLAGKAGAMGSDDEKAVKRPFCCRGGLCVIWIILGVVVIGILLTLMLLFIL